jgi:hypothetical protein
MAWFPVQRGLPRELRAMTYLVAFLVTTVATVLVTRGVLALLGWPQLGGNGLHIAHAVWGGLILAVGIVVLLSFVGPIARPVAAFVSGIGFGLFLDEVGKFVTGSNNYFFRPAAAIMYVVVVLFLLAIQWVHGRHRPYPQELLSGAMNEAVAGASGGISDVRRGRALALARAAGDEPGAAETVALLRALPRSTKEPGDPLTWVGDKVRRIGGAFVRKRWLRITVVTVLCISSALSLVTAVATLVIEFFLPESIKHDAHAGLSVWGSIPAILAVICVVIGIRRLRRNPTSGYAWFERAVLIDLLLTQPVVVAADQFSALPSIVIDLVMLAVLGAAKAAAQTGDLVTRGSVRRDEPQPVPALKPLRAPQSRAR